MRMVSLYKYLQEIKKHYFHTVKKRDYCFAFRKKYLSLQRFSKRSMCQIINDTGEMAEWSIAAVLKTVDCHRSWGSNPYLSAEMFGQNTDKIKKSRKIKVLRDFFIFGKTPERP